MTGSISIRNRQRIRRVDTGFLRRLARHLLAAHLQVNRCELCFHLVEAQEMSRINEQFLAHHGATDVITFDYADLRKGGSANAGSASARVRLHGEIFLCLAEAVAQAKTFRSRWYEELVRYLIHGVLHLCGYDDRTATARRQMKRVENRLVRLLAEEFPLTRLEENTSRRGMRASG